MRIQVAGLRECACGPQGGAPDIDRVRRLGCGSGISRLCPGSGIIRGLTAAAGRLAGWLVRNYDLEFLKRFSMVIAFLVAVTLGLILFARHLNGSIQHAPDPAAKQRVLDRIAPTGAVYAGATGAAAQAEAMKAADTLDAKGLSTSVADLRFVKPLDDELIRRMIATHEVIITVEEGAVGGLGAHVLTLASDLGLTDGGLKIRTMRLPDIFQDQNSPEKQYDEAGLNAPQIVDTVLKALRHNSAGVEEAGVRA